MRFYEGFPGAVPEQESDDRAVVRIGSTLIELVKSTGAPEPMSLAVAALKPENAEAYFRKHGSVKGHVYQGPGGTPFSIRDNRNLFNPNAWEK